MPYYINKIEDKTQLDHLLDYLDGEFAHGILDLRHPLLKAKKKEQLYYRCDTHWNQKGAYIAYENILARISPWFTNEKTLAPAPVNETTKISKTLGLPESYRGTAPLVTLNEQCSTVRDDMVLPQIGLIESQCLLPGSVPKQYFGPWFLETLFLTPSFLIFQRTLDYLVYVWHPYDQETMPKLLERMKPELLLRKLVKDMYSSGTNLNYARDFWARKRPKTEKRLVQGFSC